MEDEIGRWQDMWRDEVRFDISLLGEWCYWAARTDEE
jgi:hypothetical protein